MKTKTLGKEIESLNSNIKDCVTSGVLCV